MDSDLALKNVGDLMDVGGGWQSESESDGEVVTQDGTWSFKRSRGRGWGVRCTATCKARHAQCRKAAMVGGTVCRVHGGAAPQVKARAKARIEALLPEAIRVLADAMAHGPEHQRLRAARYVLRYSGIRPDNIWVTERESRRALGAGSAGPESIDAEIEEMLGQLRELRSPEERA